MKRSSIESKNKKSIWILIAKIFGFLLILLAISSALLYNYLYKPSLVLKTDFENLLANSKTLKAVAKENDLDRLTSKIKELEQEYDLIKSDAKKIMWAKNIPFFGKYIEDLESGLKAGDALISAGNLSLKAITPYADLIGFKKGGASFSEKSADDRIASAVLTLDKLTLSVDDIAEKVKLAETEISNINPQDYPEKIGERVVRERLIQLKDNFDSVASLFVNAKGFVKKLPSFLGADAPKTYLIWFQNDTELRSTGGFLTAYAVFKVDKGRFEVIKSEDIYTLDASISKRPPVPQSILTYHKGVKTYFIRDSNLSPDFPTSVKLFEELYKNSNEVKNYDAIVAMDTKVLVDTLRVLGETSAGGLTFKADEDKRCDCPQVLYELLNDIDRPVGYLKADRKGILGDLLYEIMKKALGFSPSQYWGPLANDMVKNMQEKHIMFNFKDPESQKAIEAVNFGGNIVKTDSDYLHISDTNFAGAKSNLFVQHSITSKTIFGSSSANRELIIEYKNPYKFSDCNLERGNLCLNATLRNWIRIYVPLGSKLNSFVGSLKPTRTYDELGYTVIEGYTQVDPEGKTTVTVKYTLPSKLNDKKSYSLLVQKQPGTKGHAFNVIIDGKSQKTKLITDMTFQNKQ